MHRQKLPSNKLTCWVISGKHHLQLLGYVGLVCFPARFGQVLRIYTFPIGLGTGVEEWDATRQGGLTATCTHSRSILTLLKPKLSKIHLNDESGRNIELKCKDGPAVKMHVVGRTQAEEIDWMMIDSIDASKRPMEWG